MQTIGTAGYDGQIPSENWLRESAGADAGTRQGRAGARGGGEAAAGVQALRARGGADSPQQAGGRSFMLVWSVAFGALIALLLWSRTLNLPLLAGGLIALVHEGDRITIDAQQNLITVDIPDGEWQRVQLATRIGRTSSVQVGESGTSVQAVKAATSARA